jgi:hypothetical protein
MQASKLLYYEATDHFYLSNTFAISLDTYPITTIDVPSGWHLPRISKLQLELQLKDAQRMNTYVDWTSFFSQFTSLRHLRIIPSFHARYYDWASGEFATWEGAHYVFQAFFRELLVGVPEGVELKLGPSGVEGGTMLLEGRQSVSRGVLRRMYDGLGVRRDGSGRVVPGERVVECRGG